MSIPTPKPGAAAPAGSRHRMMMYGLVIVVLFGVMYPYTEKLNELKRDKGLGEATIGQIDTGSFMLKLALLGGFRGVAANVLWTRAIELQKMHEWDQLQQSVDMITKLQPHFLSVWTFQSWNLAYNVSVEWDDPADKYEWIKKGINFVKRGVDNNVHSPDLLWDTAWYYYHKFGFADEAVILRKLFRDDTDEDFKHNPLPALYKTEYQIDNSDNFQVGYAWFTKAVQLVDAGQETMGGRRATETSLETDIQYVDKPVQHKGRPGDINFRSMPAHAAHPGRGRAREGQRQGLSPHLRPGRQGRVGQGVAGVADVGRLPLPRLQRPGPAGPSRLGHPSRRVRPTDPFPEILVRSLGQRHELSLLERPCACRGNRRGRDRPPAVLRGDPRLQGRQLPGGCREVQARA